MLPLFFACAAALLLAGRPVAAVVQQTQAPAFAVQSVQALGAVTSDNSRAVYDNGYSGKVGRFQINAYGDSVVCGNGNDLTNCMDAQGNMFFGSNSAGYDTMIPTKVTTVMNTTSNLPMQFCPKMDIAEEQSNPMFAIGLTNPVETGADKGIIFVMPNDRSSTNTNNVLGSAVAIVDASGNQPTCTRTAHVSWNAAEEPVWGDHGVVDGNDGNLYAFGQTYWNTADQWAFVMRAPKASATTVDAWNYWNGTGWQTERLIKPGPEAAVFQHVNAGGFMWNAHLNKWLAVTSFLMDIQMMTADNLQGPWTKVSTIYSDPTGSASHQFDYGTAFHPEYDTTGRTVIVTYATYQSIQALRVVFD